MQPAKFLYIILDTTSRKNQFYVREKEITKGLWNKFSTFDTLVLSRLRRSRGL